MSRGNGVGDTPQKVLGEWLINASILQCQDALFGRIHLTESGDMVYLSAGGELIGRGVGNWVAEGPLVGFQVDIFQYSATSAKHVQSDAHRFRGVARAPLTKGAAWSGEWYFCAFQQPPRHVGTFTARRREDAAGPDAGPKAEAAGDLPQGAKSAVIVQLDKMIELPPMSEPRWIPHLVTGDVPDVHYVRNFLEPKQVEEFERVIDRTCDWERMSTRDTQEFGSSSKCPCGRSLLRVSLPQWQTNVVTAIHNLGAFHPVLYPANSVRLNAYTPGQGIHPHMDGPVYFPRAAIITLGSHCIFDFYPREADEDQAGFSWDRDKEVPAAPELPPGTKPKMSILLEPGSLLVFSGDAFIRHRHGIADVDEDEITPQVLNAKDIGLTEGDRLRRGRRVSLTIRHLLPRCMCSSI